MDWEGPVSLGDDNTVVVEDPPRVLSEEGRDLLRQEIGQADVVTEDWMIESFTVAKVFIHEANSL